MQKSICNLTLYLFMFALNFYIDLEMSSLSNNFSSIEVIITYVMHYTVHHVYVTHTNRIEVSEKGEKKT